MGSLSHYINCRAIGYQDLPQFPESPTDSSVRCVVVPEEQEKPVKQKGGWVTDNNIKKKMFYSDSENNSEENSDESSDDSDDSTDSSSDSSYEKIEPQVKNFRMLVVLGKVF